MVPSLSCVIVNAQCSYIKGSRVLHREIGKVEGEHSAACIQCCISGCKALCIFKIGHIESDVCRVAVRILTGCPCRRQSISECDAGAASECNSVFGALHGIDCMRLRGYNKHG